MSKTSGSAEEDGEAGIYEIRIKGHLDPQWTRWFDGLAIVPEEDGDTLLRGPVADQAALHGLLKRVRDLGVPLLSVRRLEAGEAGSADVEAHAKEDRL